jgi:hypothetical protein
MKSLSTVFCTYKRRKFRLFSIFCLAVFFLVLGFSSCTKEVDYFRYVSENRSNVFLAENEDFSLKVYSLTREIPYLSDGIPKTLSTVTEVRLTAPSGEGAYEIEFSVQGKKYGGEISYDNVKSEYFFSCSLDSSKETSIPFKIKFDDTVVELNANSVRTPSTLSPKKILDIIHSSERELFKSMTDKYGFKGEIYVRLIYEDTPYYYVGLIGRDKTMYAFLVNAQTGKILAKRQS